MFAIKFIRCGDSTNKWLVTFGQKSPLNIFLSIPSALVVVFVHLSMEWQFWLSCAVCCKVCYPHLVIAKITKSIITSSSICPAQLVAIRCHKNDLHRMCNCIWNHNFIAGVGCYYIDKIDMKPNNETQYLDRSTFSPDMVTLVQPLKSRGQISFSVPLNQKEINLKFWLHCKCFHVSLQSHLNGLTLIAGMSEVGNCWVIPPSRNLSPYTEWWEDNAHENCAQCYPPLPGWREGWGQRWVEDSRSREGRRSGDP